MDRCSTLLNRSLNGAHAARFVLIQGGQSALHRACMVGDFAIAQWLVEELGFPPDFHNEVGFVFPCASSVLAHIALVARGFSES